jgi:hypothetical protein
MSFDPNQNTPPMGHAAPKKSGALKWILGGIGCFTLMIALCVGGLIYFGMQVNDIATNNAAYFKAVNSIESSSAVADVVGAPVVVERSAEKPPQRIPAEAGKIGFKFDTVVKGSNKSGEAEIIVSGELMNSDNWQVDSIKVTVDGEEIPVDEVSLDLDIDLGTETEEN